MGLVIVEKSDPSVTSHEYPPTLKALNDMLTVHKLDKNKKIHTSDTPKLAPCHLSLKSRLLSVSFCESAEEGGVFNFNMNFQYVYRLGTLILQYLKLDLNSLFLIL